MKLSAQSTRIIAGFISAFVALLAVVVWGQGVRWNFNDLSTYRIFPLFGLLAFSLMLSMYAVGFLRRRFKIEVTELGNYYKILSIVILTAILAHPGLLWWQLWRDGFGLPPESYLQHYVAPPLKWVAILGTVSWFVFLAYEFRFRYKDRKWWRYFEYAGDAAMVAIFYHGLRLGGNLQHGWFRWVWYFYGVVLLLVLIDIYTRKFKVVDRLNTWAYKDTHGS